MKFVSRGIMISNDDDSRKLFRPNMYARIKINFFLP